MTRLATFVQISDLHLGDLDPRTLDATYNDNWQYFRLLDGFLGHSHESLRKLADEFDELRQREEAQIIVTGDITASGKTEQFRMGGAFLGGIYQPPPGAVRRTILGLRVGNWKDYSIPGNHDHWPGIDSSWRPKIRGDSNSELALTLHQLPRVEDYSLPNQGHLIKFLSINTDSDVHPNRDDRLLARGNFRSQLVELEDLLSDPLEKEIRVLCLHHSMSYRADTRLGQFSRALEVDDVTRRELEQFIVKHDISVLLCGHVHDPPKVEKFVAHTAKRSAEYLEAQCGTTSQRSELPIHWKDWKRRQAKIQRQYPNCFLVHRLEEERDGLYWKAGVFWEMTAKFDQHKAHEAEVLKTDSFRVWPRL